MTNKSIFFNIIVIGENVIFILFEIKFQAGNIFSSLFNSDIADKPYIEGMVFKMSNNDSSTWLKREITSKEVNDATWSYDESKAIRHDDFNFIFFYIKKDMNTY